MLNVFVGKVFKEVIKVKQGHKGVALIHKDWYPHKKGHHVFSFTEKIHEEVGRGGACL